MMTQMQALDQQDTTLAVQHSSDAMTDLHFIQLQVLCTHKCVQAATPKIVQWQA